jgi:hypothetical protein
VLLTFRAPLSRGTVATAYEQTLKQQQLQDLKRSFASSAVAQAGG